MEITEAMLNNWYETLSRDHQQLMQELKTT